jgi:FAD/FMN-containing dehydrogenase
VLGVRSFNDILAVLGRMREAVTLSAFEFFSELALTKVQAATGAPPPLTGPYPYYALLEFDESALTAATQAFERCVEEGWVSDGVLSQSDAQAASLWALREGISESIAPLVPYKNDISVRVQDMPGFLQDVNKLVDAEYPDFEICWYGHIGDGNLHLNILKPEGLDVEAFYQHCHGISPRLFALVRDRGGSISAEHGVGLLKREFLAFSRSPEEIGLMRALKGVFDPNQIMNPGKLLA